HPVRSARRSTTPSCALHHYMLFALVVCHHPATTAIHTLSLHDALPICALPTNRANRWVPPVPGSTPRFTSGRPILPAFSLASRRSEEHTSELQSRVDLVCRLLLEKKKTIRSRRRLGERPETI